jgi:hypothetical protein
MGRIGVPGKISRASLMMMSRLACASQKGQHTGSSIGADQQAIAMPDKDAERRHFTPT